MNELAFGDGNANLPPKACYILPVSEIATNDWEGASTNSCSKFNTDDVHKWSVIEIKSQQEMDFIRRKIHAAQIYAGLL